MSHHLHTTSKLHMHAHTIAQSQVAVGGSRVQWFTTQTPCVAQASIRRSSSCTVHAHAAMHLFTCCCCNLSWCKQFTALTMRFEPGILVRASCSALQSQRRASSVEYSRAHTTADRPAKKSGSCWGVCPAIHCWLSLHGSPNSAVRTSMIRRKLNCACCAGCHCYSMSQDSQQLVSAASQCMNHTSSLAFKQSLAIVLGHAAMKRQMNTLSHVCIPVDALQTVISM